MSISLDELLKTASKEEILEEYEKALDKSEEEDFWKDKILPYVDATLSVLLPLRDQNLLFTPEGRKVEQIDKDFFYRWCDLVCLRTMAFILEQSNENNSLLRTDYKNAEYKTIDLKILGEYLNSYRVNLTDEDNLDFPVANYNLHTGMLTTIKTLIK
ncbi:hypothetical protein [Arcobacter roscoffensis]|uniref:Uncharacterized protein n=1 Tax=Arcobacter roscoffensis TaxID=2961520 RepID=A0ABY5E4Y8_9BACT|nr:hypothetical protein [Arcobacter roscoffensis]UTJ06795.1 hypothetical protein NJU99_01540 [Arcobacter roscoffensis]